MATAADRTRPEAAALAGRWLALAAALAVTVARAPQLFVAPRLWAEEGSTYFAHAIHHTFLQTLFLVPTSWVPAGYYNLAANLPAAFAAHLLPIELVPWATLGVALVCQTIPIAIVLFGDSLLWRRPRERFLCCALLVVGAPIVPEAWLNTINAQLFCGLTALLIVCERFEPLGARQRGIYRALFVFCALSGPYAAFLLPTLWLRTRLTPGAGEARVLLRIVLATTAAQGVVYAAVRATAAIEIDRLGSAPIADRALAALVHHVLRPFFGGLVTDDPGLVLSQAWYGTIRGSRTAVLVAALVLAGLLVTWIVTHLRHAPRTPLALLILAGLAWSGATTLLAHGLPTSRYAMLPGMAVLFTVAMLAWRHRSRAVRGAAFALVAVALVCGALTVLFPSPRSSRFLDGPAWRDEVAAWHRDPDRGLLIWPSRAGHGWRVHLTGSAEFANLRRILGRQGTLALVSRGEWTERSVAIAGLPPDFKLTWTAEMTQGSDRADVAVILKGAADDAFASRELDGLTQQRPQRFLLEASGLQRDPNRRWHEARRLGFRLRANGSAPVRLTVGELDVAPRVEGLLDPALREIHLPTRLYAGEGGPIAAEATTLGLAASLWHDRDRRYCADDRQREVDRWKAPTAGLHLRPLPDGSRRFGGSATAAALLAPVLAAAGPRGLIVLNLVLYAAMALLAFRALDGPRRARCEFVAAFFLASVGLAAVFLPHDRILVACCLFVPVWLWRRGHLDRPAWPASMVAGMLLAVAATATAVPAGLIGLILAVDLARRRHGRALVALAAGTAAVAACAALGAGLLDPMGCSEPGPLAAAGALSASAADETSTWLDRSTRVLFGFPLVIYALLAGRASKRRDLLLLAGLVAASLWTILADPGPTAGWQEPAFTSIAPLFALLPARVGGSSRRFLFFTAVAVVLVWPALSVVWAP